MTRKHRKNMQVAVVQGTASFSLASNQQEIIQILNLNSLVSTYCNPQSGEKINFGSLKCKYNLKVEANYLAVPIVVAVQSGGTFTNNIESSNMRINDCLDSAIDTDYSWERVGNPIQAIPKYLATNNTYVGQGTVNLQRLATKIARITESPEAYEWTYWLCLAVFGPVSANTYYLNWGVLTDFEIVPRSLKAL